jgi:hypothetical protein
MQSTVIQAAVGRMTYRASVMLIMVVPSRVGNPVSQSFIKLISVTFRDPSTAQKAGDRERSPAKGRNEDKETSGTVLPSFGKQSISQMSKLFPHKRIFATTFFSILNLCLC